MPKSLFVICHFKNIYGCVHDMLFEKSVFFSLLHELIKFDYKWFIQIDKERLLYITFYNHKTFNN